MARTGAATRSAPCGTSTAPASSTTTSTSTTTRKARTRSSLTATAAGASRSWRSQPTAASRNASQCRGMRSWIRCWAKRSRSGVWGVGSEAWEKTEAASLPHPTPYSLRPIPNHRNHVIQDPQRSDQQVYDVAKKRRLLVLVHAVPDELENPPEDEERDVDRHRQPRADEVERDRDDQHRNGQTPLQREVIDDRDRDQHDGRVDAESANVGDAHALQHAEEREHDQRDAEAVKPLVAFGLVIRGVIGEGIADVRHARSLRASAAVHPSVTPVASVAIVG